MQGGASGYGTHALPASVPFLFPLLSGFFLFYGFLLGFYVFRPSCAVKVGLHLIFVQKSAERSNRCIEPFVLYGFHGVPACQSGRPGVFQFRIHAGEIVLQCRVHIKSLRRIQVEQLHEPFRFSVGILDRVAFV